MLSFASIEGPLKEEDAELPAPPEETKQPVLKRLTERHRQLARLLASGAQNNVAASMTGFTPSRVSVLRSDPSFGELIAYYRGQVDEQFIDHQSEIYEKLALVSKTALNKMLEFLEEDGTDGEAMTMEQVQSVMQSGVDRLGFSPKAQAPTKSNNVNVDIAVRMERAQERLMNHRTIEGKAEDDE
jgi:hypothetical protein